ncbi:MAG TPA: FtsQ-type POTRA domain-containing protein [Acidobacteriaceae bacterium]|jgi:cell division protein FtsQ|nr:FtsQ-type POTRA domain-containing protein [Acidobacteriaceae bacterium]
MPLRRNASYANGYSGDMAPESEFEQQSTRPRVHLSFHGGLLPKSLWGRIAMSSGLLLLAGAGVAAVLAVRNFLLHDGHFTVSGSQSIQIAGNSRLTTAQLLSVFGEDVERNIFNIPMAQRRAELERLPWVEHATVMRLLPNRVRVAIVERTPVAFVRQGAEIGLVDANGVLLNLPGPDLSGAGSDDSRGQPTGSVARNAPHYSFPVLTGLSAQDPLSVRSARMKIYLGFVAALDAGGENISHRLSEVDVSNPEDVKAILPDPASDASGATDILVHFGDGKYLQRYRQYEQHLAEWRAQYPKLASVDLRYERQVVLEMQPGAAAAASDSAAAGAATTTPAETVVADSAKPQAHSAAATLRAHAAAAKPKNPLTAKKLTGKPAASAAAMQGDAR